MPNASSARRRSLFSSVLLCVPMAACSIYADLPTHRGESTGPATGGSAGAAGGVGVTGGATSATGQGGSSGPGSGGQGGNSGTSGEGGSGGVGGSGGAGGMPDASADSGRGATAGAGGNAGAGGAGGNAGSSGAGAGGGAGAAGAGGGSSGGAAGSVVVDGGPMTDSAGAAGASGDGSSAGGAGGAAGSSGTAGSAGKAGGGGSGGVAGSGGGGGSSGSGGSGGADAGSKDAPFDGGLCSTGACKRVFVSSSSPAATGAFGGLVAADSFCQSSAVSKQLGGTWKAWLSTSSASASARLAHATVPYRLLDGSTVAGNWAGLTSGTLSHTINVTEAGVIIPGSTILEVWTGTTTAGAHSGDTCNGWTDGSATPTADVGLTSETGSGWTAKYLQFCNRTNLRLYCFEQ